MQDLIKLIDAIAWPITILVIVVFFRVEFRKIISRLSKIKYKGLVADFEKQLSEAEKQLNASKKHTSEINQISSDAIGDKLKNLSNIENSLLRISEISPKAAILEAWTNLELQSKYAAEKYEISKNENNIIFAVLKKLIPIFYNESIIESYYNLLALRNQAIHSADFDISTVDAKKYIELVMNIAKMMAWRSEREIEIRGDHSKANKSVQQTG